MVFACFILRIRTIAFQPSTMLTQQFCLRKPLDLKIRVLSSSGNLMLYKCILLFASKSFSPSPLNTKLPFACFFVSVIAELSQNLSMEPFALYFLFKFAAPSSSVKLLSVTVVRILNELYGSDTLSTLELAKRVLNPTYISFLFIITTSELVCAHDELGANCNMKLRLSSNVALDPSIKAGRLAPVLAKQEKMRKKKGLWACLYVLYFHSTKFLY